MPLTEIKCKNAKPKDKAYKLSDGGGLYLEIKLQGGKYWRFKYRHGGKEKCLTIGVYAQLAGHSFPSDMVMLWFRFHVHRGSICHSFPSDMVMLWYFMNVSPVYARHSFPSDMVMLWLMWL